MVRAIPDETKEVKGLGEDVVIQFHVGPLTEDENRESNYFEYQVQEEQNQCDICGDNSADKGNKDLDQQHKIFSSLKGFSHLQNKSNLLASNMQLPLLNKKCVSIIFLCK